MSRSRRHQPGVQVERQTRPSQPTGIESAGCRRGADHPATLVDGVAILGVCGALLLESRREARGGYSGSQRAVSASKSIGSPNASIGRIVAEVEIEIRSCILARKSLLNVAGPVPWSVKTSKS